MRLCVSCLHDVRSDSLVEFWSILEHSTVDGGVIYFHSSLCHHLLQVSIAEGVTAIPAEVGQDDVR
jgi:hypothetical protein